MKYTPISTWQSLQGFDRSQWQKIIMAVNGYTASINALHMKSDVGVMPVCMDMWRQISSQQPLKFAPLMSFFKSLRQDYLKARINDECHNALDDVPEKHLDGEYMFRCHGYSISVAYKPGEKTMAWMKCSDVKYLKRIRFSHPARFLIEMEGFNPKTGRGLQASILHHQSLKASFGSECTRVHKLYDRKVGFGRILAPKNPNRNEMSNSLKSMI